MKHWWIYVSAFVLFFVFGRLSQAPRTLEHDSPDHFVAEPPAKQAAAAVQNQKTTAPQIEKSAPQQAVETKPPRDWNDVLKTATGTELYEALYSQQFVRDWKAEKGAVIARLLSPLPTQSHSDDYDRDVVDRLGFLKALGKISQQTDDGRDVKNFLISFVGQSHDLPWVLQREATHSLLGNASFSEVELENVLPKLDARSRDTASVPDSVLAERAVGVQSEN